MKAMISDLRKDIYSQMRQKRQEFEPMLSDPAFKVGPEIIEKYDFNLPKLTQELDDNALARYSQLLVSEDVRFGKCSKNLPNGSIPFLNPIKQAKENLGMIGFSHANKG